MLFEIEQREVGEFYVVCGSLTVAGPFASREDAQHHLDTVLDELRSEGY